MNTTVSEAFTYDMGTADGTDRTEPTVYCWLEGEPGPVMSISDPDIAEQAARALLRAAADLREARSAKSSPRSERVRAQSE